MPHAVQKGFKNHRLYGGRNPSVQKTSVCDQRALPIGMRTCNVAGDTASSSGACVGADCGRVRASTRLPRASSCATASASSSSVIPSSGGSHGGSSLPLLGRGSFRGSSSTLAVRAPSQRAYISSAAGCLTLRGSCRLVCFALSCWRPACSTVFASAYEAPCPCHGLDAMGGLSGEAMALCGAELDGELRSFAE